MQRVPDRRVGRNIRWSSRLRDGQRDESFNIPIEADTLPLWRRYSQFNLAMSYFAVGQHLAANTILEALQQSCPHEHRFGVRLAMCYKRLGNLTALRPLLDDLDARFREPSLRAREQLKTLAAAGKLAVEQRQKIRRLHKLASFDPFAVQFLRGYIALSDRDETGALEYFREAEEAEVLRPGLLNQIGETYLRLKRPDDAIRIFKRAIDIDDENPRHHLGLCRCYLDRRQNRRAARAAMRTIRLFYGFPRAHLCLGIALQRLFDRPVCQPGYFWATISEIWADS